MKAIVVICTLLSTAFACSAQTETATSYPSVSNPIVSPMSLSQTKSGLTNQSQTGTTRPPGFRVKNTGRVLTFFGCFMIAGGVLLINTVDREETYNPHTGTTSGGDDPALLIGSTMCVAGAGMTIPGVILWVHGSHKYKKHLDSKKAVTSIQIKRNGLSLNYRF